MTGRATGRTSGAVGRLAFVDYLVSHRVSSFSDESLARLPRRSQTVSESLATYAVRPDQLLSKPVDAPSHIHCYGMLMSALPMQR
jgi:hypothetical protein